MRIGIDARLLGAAHGIGRYIELITSRLFVIGSKHEYVIFLNPDMAEIYKLPSGVNIRVVVAPERWYSWSEQVTWPWRLRRERLDLLWVPQFNVPLITPCPFVVTIHDVTQLYVPGRLQHRSTLRRFAFRLAFSHAVHSARVVIAVSEYTRQEIVKNFGIAANRIKVIYEGPGLLPATTQGDIPHPISHTRGERSRTIPYPYLLAVSIWRQHKNFDGLVKAFAKARQENKDLADAKLVLVGEEDTRYPEVRTAIDRLGLRDVVVTPGNVDDEELDEYYRGARAVIVPSFYEGFGFPGLEAMTRGIPVAASRVTALPEVLGDAAYYFNPEDIEEMARAIRDIMTNSKIRERILLAAPKVLGRYSWDRAAEETIRIIETVKNR